MKRVEPIDVYEEISSDTGSQTTDEDSGRLFNREMYTKGNECSSWLSKSIIFALQGVPDCICYLDCEETMIVVCGEVSRLYR